MYVAPYTGAWIETASDIPNPISCASLPTRERGLKHGQLISADIVWTSLPTRERGLKPLLHSHNFPAQLSLPTRERGPSVPM